MLDSFGIIWRNIEKRLEFKRYRIQDYYYVGGRIVEVFYLDGYIYEK